MHDHTDHCLVADYLPSGQIRLRCKHTGQELRHLGRHAYLARVVHAPRDPDLSYVDLAVKVRIPLRCDADTPFELLGVTADCAGCNCPSPVTKVNAEARPEEIGAALA